MHILKLRDLAFGFGAVSAGLLVYGAVWESNRLVVESFTLRPRRWPKRLDPFRIALLGDLHIRDEYSFRLAKRAVLAAVETSPDMVVFVGDFVAYWKPECIDWLAEALDPVLLMEGSAVAVAGNHEYVCGTPEFLRPILDRVNTKLLRNELWVHQGIQWIGIDSANAHRANPFLAMQDMSDDPAVVLWHEPDVVEWLPDGADLMLSGHTHGGQFRFPGGIVPMTTENGRRYLDGWFPEAPTPLFVTRGIGTTGPPSRFLCAPQVAILNLIA